MLARKWRPRLFREMVGQEHVLKALINALDHNRLHHADLFTGTRGVGKTTIARILAKCLNCETGVSSEPCDQCSACTEINDGRFVDLIEVDAASRTKVEDTRELLENVQYAPTRGRYKVYLIDEVHMLSNSSFNALLKTLEEPPPHVKFLLATTDPQKLPVTVLSRCLQFSLKNMSAERIVGHLQHILEKEMIPFEDAGLWQLGRAADGSMRDALSLTDQSIAFSDGKITEADVRTMLGTIDQSLVYTVLEGLKAEDGKMILEAVAQLAEHAPDYSGVLSELIAVLHRIAIAQVLPEAVDNSLGDRQQIYELAQSIASEDIQLYYQTALMGRRDLSLSPDPRSGFEMVMLRMLAFKPQGLADLPTQRLSQPVGAEEAPQTVKKSSSEVVEALPTGDQSPPKHLSEPTVSSIATQEQEPPSTVNESMPAPKVETLASPLALAPDLPEAHLLEAENRPGEEAPVAPPFESSTVVESASVKLSVEQLSSETWFSVYQQLDVGGLLQSTVANSAYMQRIDNTLEFILDEEQSTLYDVAHQQRMADLLSEYFQQTVQVSIQLGQPLTETPAHIILRQQQQRQREAEQAIQSDPVVKQLQETFGAVIVEDSIKPID